MLYFIKYGQPPGPTATSHVFVVSRVFAAFPTSCTESTFWNYYSTSCTGRYTNQAGTRPAAPRQGGSAGNARNTRAKYKNARATTNTNKYANMYRICVFICIWKYEAPYCCITKLCGSGHRFIHETMNERIKV